MSSNDQSVEAQLMAAPPSAARRQALKLGGATVMGTLVTGCATATRINPAIPPVAKLIDDPAQTDPTAVTVGSVPPGPDPAVKPTYVAQARDPVAYSVADNLFWNDIMMEHALFFVQLLPGPDLEAPRRQAEEFQRLFAAQLAQSRGINRDNYVAFNQKTIDLTRRFSDYKKTLKQQQESGRIHSLIWPMFLEHTAREADRFASRLGMYSKREIEFERAEVIDFWSQTMGEHSAFIAHLLDPSEKLLIGQASKLQDAFLDSGLRDTRGDEVMKAAQEVLAFKSVAEKGVKSGKIKSIARPELTAHVRREAVRFVDELRRTGSA